MFEQSQKTNVASAEDSASRGAVFKKFIVLFLGIVFSAGTGALIEYSFRTSNMFVFLLWAAVGCVIWIFLYAVFSLATSWVTAAVLAGIYSLLSCVPLLIRMGGYGALVLWLVFAVIALFGYMRAAQYMSNAIHVRARDVFSGLRASSIVFISLLIAFAYTIPRSSQKGLFVTKADIQALFQAGDPVVRLVYPGYQSDATINSLVDTLVQKQKASDLSGIQDMVNQIPQGFELPNMNQLLEAAKKEARANMISQLSSWFGMKLKGTETLPDIIFAWLDNAYLRLSPETQSMIEKVFAGIVFVTLYTVLRFFGFIFDMLFIAMFSLLRALRIVRIGTMMVEKETLLL